jgi:hypothetical protein
VERNRDSEFAARGNPGKSSGNGTRRCASAPRCSTPSCRPA